MDNLSPYVLASQLGHIPTTKEKVPVECPKCKGVKNVVLASHLQTIRRNGGEYLCHKCSIDRKKCSQNAKKLWSDPVKAGRIVAHLRSDKMREAVSNKNKRLFSDEEWKRRWIAKINRQAISDKSKEMWKSEEFRRKISKSFSERCKKQWQDPAYRAKIEAYRSTEEYKDRNALVRQRMAENKSSKQQDILCSLLDDLGVPYQQEVKIGYYLFDCLVGSLLIEVQGYYWHSLPKTIRNDKSKATYLRKYFPNYTLRYIWEHEFSNKSRVVSLLRYWLGLSEPENVDFSFNDIDIKIIDHKEAELFISKYHYAGRLGRSGFHISYYLEDKLIAVCAYAYPVRKEVAIKQGLRYKQVFELIRLAIHPQYQKKNFASFIIGRSVRLVKKQHPEIRRLVSFADSTYNHRGIVYEASNWKFDGEVNPSYWYVDNDGYICHKKTLWNKAKEMKLTEAEYCDKYEYRKVWGGPKRRFVYALEA